MAAVRWTVVAVTGVLTRAHNYTPEYQSEGQGKDVTRGTALQTKKSMLL